MTAISVRATDTAGNAVERTITVRRTVAPDLRLDPTGTQYVNASTVVGPFDVPVVPAVGIALLGLGAVARAR